MQNPSLKWMGDQSTRKLVRVLLTRYLRPYLRYLIIGLICMMAGAACTALLAKQMKPIIDDVFVGRQQEMLLTVAMQVFLLFLVKGLCAYGDTVSMTYVGESIVADMRRRMFMHLMKADLLFFHNTPSGTLISRFLTDVNMIHNVVSRTVTSIAKDGLTVLFLTGLLFYEDWMLASIAFFVFPIAILPIVRIGKRMRRSSSTIQQGFGDLTILLSQVFQGARTVKSYGMQDHEMAKADGLIRHILKNTLKAVRLKAAAHPLMEVLGGVAIMVIIFYGGHQVIQGHETSGAFFSFITALLLAYEPLKRLANLNTELQEKLAAVGRIFTLLDVAPEIVDASTASPLRLSKGEIRFSDVHFSYTPDKKALRGVDFIVPAGKTAALVGESGSGKSTLMNLIPRFYEIEEGGITIDGEDIRQVTLESLRKSIALVSQEVTLFDDTITNNILYGDPKASQEEVIEAAKAAAAHDFIINLPQGYDTVVGEHGVKLSGGQRQRLSIARAMIKNAPILLLDEATSALDSESEQKVQQALETLMTGRTTLIIAHRFATVLHADIIYVVKDGRIVASGSHGELLSSHDEYARLCEAQLIDTSFKSVRERSAR